MKEFEIESEKCHYHYFLIIEKQKNYLIVDFDDFSEEHCPQEELERLKKENPAFKVTLFAIPSRTTLLMLSWAKKNKDWVELAVHGWTHFSNYECANFTYEQCQEVLNRVRGSGFVKGFKAPGWQISDGCYQALKDYGYWVADQHYNDNRRPKDLRVYYVGENSYHGHTWDCGCQNGIYEDWENILEKVKKAKEFKFISEVV